MEARVVILVLLRVDGPSGSATLVCTEIAQDPLFPDKVLLQGVQGLSWPIGQEWVNVRSWSVSKADVLNWMAGPLQAAPSLTLDSMEGKDTTPWPPGTLPNQALNNDPAEIKALLPRAPAAPPQESPPPETLLEKPKKAKKSKP